MEYKMDSLELIKTISKISSTKIVMLVIDGLGGLPHPDTGKTEMETARTLNLDRLAEKGICGMVDPISPGITPGSTPGHLALFGYDPLKYNIGRGVVEALGIDMELGADAVAVRGNFCTVDDEGIITDRRAGRISTDKNIELCHLLDGMEIDGIKVKVVTVKEHRFVVVFTGEGLEPDITDSDPQQTGMAPNTINPSVPDAVKMSQAANQFIERAGSILKNHNPANMLVLRGFSKRPQLYTMAEVYKLKGAAIAIYPMYRGLSRLLGMNVLDAGKSIEDEFEALKNNYSQYDFFFLHIKHSDSAGEDGDFNRKVSVIEQVDNAVATLIDIKPDVIVVTGDHSTPAVLAGHSWHQVPTLIYSKWCRTDTVKKFSETECLYGGLGRMPAVRIMPLVMANALKLNKFGA